MSAPKKKNVGEVGDRVIVHNILYMEEFVKMEILNPFSS